MRARRHEFARGGRVALPALAAVLGMGLAAALWHGGREPGREEPPAPAGTASRQTPGAERQTPERDAGEEAGTPPAMLTAPPASSPRRRTPPTPTPDAPAGGAPSDDPPAAAARHLAELLRSPSAGDEDLAAALEALADAIAPLSPGSGDPVTDRLLAEAAALLRDTALASGEDVAETAVALLEDIPIPESVSALAEVLRSGRSEDLRLRAIDAITYLDLPGAAGALAVGLADASEPVREAAAQGMGWVDERDPRTLRDLFAAQASEPDPDVRELLVQVLEDIQSDLQDDGAGGAPAP